MTQYIPVFFLSSFLFSFQFAYVLKEVNFYALTGFLVFLSAVFLKPSLLFKKPFQAVSKVNFTFLLFALYIAISVLWSPSPYVKYQKAFFWILFTVPCFYLAQKIDFEKFTKSIFALVTLTVIGTCVQMHWTKNIAFVLGNNYLVAGQTFGLGIIVSLFYFSKSSIFPVITGASLALMLFTGGRGPLVSLTAALIILVFTQRGKLDLSKKNLLLLSLSFVGTFCFCYFLSSVVTPLTINRLFEALTPLQDGAIQERFLYYHTAFETFLKNPIFGCGLGGWPYLTGLGDKQWHPHNLFLELASETGAFGLLLLGIFGVFYINSFENFKKFIFHPLFGLLLFACLNAMKSGDINDNILVWVTLGLLKNVNKKPDDVFF